MSILKKVCAIIGIIICIVAYMFFNPCLAYDTSEEIVTSVKVSDDIGLGDLNKYKGDNANSSKLVGKANVIVSLIQIVGTVASVAVLIALGIKYMLGSVEEKAQYKETFGKYILGAFFLFTITLIPQIIYTIMKNFG